MANLKSRLEKLEQRTHDPHAASMFEIECLIRWACAERIPGETEEQAALQHKIGASGYSRPMPHNDADLLQVAYGHALAEGDTTAPNAEAWKAERIAAHESGTESLKFDFDILERAGAKNIERQLAEAAHNKE